MRGIEHPLRDLDKHHVEGRFGQLTQICLVRVRAACCSRHHCQTMPTVPWIEHLSIFKREIMGFLEGDCTSHLHRTRGTSQCRLCAPGIKTRGQRMVAVERRSALAHSAHRSPAAYRSRRQQARSWSLQEDGSLAQALQNAAQECGIGATLHAYNRSTGQLDMNRAAAGRLRVGRCRR